MLTAAVGGSYIGGSFGRIRLEAFQQVFNGPISGSVSYGTPFGVFLPTNFPFPSIRVVSIGGVPVPTNPHGEFTVPDVVINVSTPVVFAVEAHNIPLGTIAKIYLQSEDATDQVIDSTPLSGTIESSTASASVTVPRGMSRGTVRATWN